MPHLGLGQSGLIKAAPTERPISAPTASETAPASSLAAGGAAKHISSDSIAFAREGAAAAKGATALSSKSSFASTIQGALLLAYKQVESLEVTAAQTNAHTAASFLKLVSVAG